MSTLFSGGDDAAESRARARVVRPRRRFKLHILAPAVVGGAVAVLLGAASREVLRPARPVSATPAVWRSTAAVGGNASAGVQPPTPGAEPDATTARIGQTVQAPGWLEPEPYPIAVSALTDGVIAEVLVLEGQTVEAGQAVARLVAEDAELALRRAEAALAAGEAALAAAEAERTAARTDWENPVERERAVAAAAAELAETEAELAQLPSLIQAERATLVGLEEELARMRQAVEAQAANEVELIRLRQHTEAQRAQVLSTEARRGMLEARRDRQRAELHAAEEHLRLRSEDRRRLDAAEAEVRRAEAAVREASAARDEARLRLERCVIRAPISGAVQRRMKGPGDVVMLEGDSPDAPQIVTLYEPERLQVRVDVPLADAAKVVVGQRCEIVVEVLPERSFAGEVTRVTREADLQKNTLQMKVRVIDPDPILRPEMLARVKFLGGAGGTLAAGNRASGGRGAGEPDGRVLVPAAALDRGPGGVRVWTIAARRNGRGEARPVPVDVLEEAEDGVIVAGLNPGDLVITDHAGLEPGEGVKLTEAGS